MDAWQEIWTHSKHVRLDYIRLSLIRFGLLGEVKLGNVRLSLIRLRQCNSYPSNDTAIVFISNYCASTHKMLFRYSIVDWTPLWWLCYIVVYLTPSCCLRCACVFSSLRPWVFAAAITTNIHHTVTTISPHIAPHYITVITPHHTVTTISPTSHHPTLHHSTPHWHHYITHITPHYTTAHHTDTTISPTSPRPTPHHASSFLKMSSDLH